MNNELNDEKRKKSNENKMKRKKIFMGITLSLLSLSFIVIAASSIIGVVNTAKEMKEDIIQKEQIEKEFENLPEADKVYIYNKEIRKSYPQYKFVGYKDAGYNYTLTDEELAAQIRTDYAKIFNDILVKPEISKFKNSKSEIFELPPEDSDDVTRLFSLADIGAVRDDGKGNYMLNMIFNHNYFQKNGSLLNVHDEEELLQLILDNFDKEDVQFIECSILDNSKPDIEPFAIYIFKRDPNTKEFKLELRTKSTSQ